MKTMPTPRMDLNQDEVRTLLERAQAVLTPQDYEKVKALVEMAVYLSQAIEDRQTTIARLRKLLFGSGSEKTQDVVPPTPAAPPPTVPDGAAPPEPADGNPEPNPPSPGHGRHGAEAYQGAEKVRVPHAFLHSGDPCPECKQGTVYELAGPGVLVRIVGQAPVQATVYELQKLRCNLCGKVFTAQAPRGAGSEKYDATAASMIALAALRSAAQHEAEVRERASLQPLGRAAGEPGHSPAGLDPVGHPPRHRRYGRAGL